MVTSEVIEAVAVACLEAKRNHADSKSYLQDCSDSFIITFKFIRLFAANQKFYHFQASFYIM